MSLMTKGKELIQAYNAVSGKVITLITRSLIVNHSMMINI